MPDTDGGPDWWLLTVSEDEDGTRIDRFLRRSVNRLRQGPVEKMLRSGLIRLDGNRAKPADRLVAGQVLRLPPHLREGPPPQEKPHVRPADNWLRKDFAALSRRHEQSCASKRRQMVGASPTGRRPVPSVHVELHSKGEAEWRGPPTMRTWDAVYATQPCARR